MKYTRYIAAICKENGPPKLSTSQFRRLMNIVYAEGVKNGLTKAKNTYKDTPHFYRYDVLIFKTERQLVDLTGNIAPENLLLEMYTMSGRDWMVFSYEYGGFKFENVLNIC